MIVDKVFIFVDLNFYNFEDYPVLINFPQSTNFPIAMSMKDNKHTISQLIREKLKVGWLFHIEGTCKSSKLQHPTLLLSPLTLHKALAAQKPIVYRVAYVLPSSQYF